MKRLVALVAVLWSCAGFASPPDLQLVGEAELKVLFWPVYHSRLYTGDGRYHPDQRPVRLEIQYLRTIDADDLISRTALEWEQQGLAHERQQQWLETLNRLWPDVNENDVLALELDENDRSTFYFNGEVLGTLSDRDFGTHFLGIWLSPQTSRPELRAALIGR